MLFISCFFHCHRWFIWESCCLGPDPMGSVWRAKTVPHYDLEVPRHQDDTDRMVDTQSGR